MTERCHDEPVPLPEHCGNLGPTLDEAPETRIQLCGNFVARWRGVRIDDALAAGQARKLFAYLVIHRSTPLSRDQLAYAVWGENAPSACDAALSALLSKLRKLLADDSLQGRAQVRLSLPDTAWVDVVAAHDALHRAQAALHRGEWASAYGPATVSYHIAARLFLSGLEASWIDEQRGRMEQIHLTGAEYGVLASLRLGITELPQAEYIARELVRRAPYRESGYQLLMRVLAAQGNVAEALAVYEGARRVLRDELGTSPGRQLQDLHSQLLRGEDTTPSTELQFLGHRHEVGIGDLVD